MSILTLVTLLAGDPATSQLCTQIGPPDAAIDQAPPYIVLRVTGTEPFNSLSGFAGLNRTEIEMTAWALNYQDALKIANAARAAVEGSGNYTIHEPGDETAFQQDLVLFGHSYVFQIFD